VQPTANAAPDNLVASANPQLLTDVWARMMEDAEVAVAVTNAYIAAGEVLIITRGQGGDATHLLS
jgi:hypothetical protein